MLRPINSFQARTGVAPHFDQGDVITDGTNTIVINNISSMKSGVIYTIQSGQIDFRDTNKNFTLVKKGDSKIKYFISNDGNAQPNLLEIALGQEPYPEWFEKEYSKL